MQKTKLDNYGDRLIYIMKKKGYGPTKLGDAIGKSAQTIQYLRTPGDKVSKYTPAICKELDINEEWLNDGTGPISSNITKVESKDIDPDTLALIIEVIIEVQTDLLKDGTINEPLETSRLGSIAATLYNEVTQKQLNRQDLVNQLRLSFKLSI